MNNSSAVRIRSINTVLESKSVNVGELAELASEGLLQDSLRIRVWPNLLGVDPEDLKIDHKAVIIKHRDWDQVERDVERSLLKLEKNEQLDKRKELSNVIHSVLSVHSDLNYYQGYHDIASVLLLVCGEQLAFVLLKKLSLYHIRDFLNPNFDVVKQILQHIFNLLQVIDLQVYNFINDSKVEPYFALSWVLTWFSHSIDDLAISARLFDFFISSHPMAVVYMSVAVIIHRREALFKCRQEYSTVHTFLTKLPPDLPYDQIVAQTRLYLTKYSPEKFELKDSNMPSYPFPWQLNWKGGPPKKPSTNYWCYLSLMTIVIVAVGFAAYRHLPFFFDSTEQSETIIKS